MSTTGPSGSHASSILAGFAALGVALAWLAPLSATWRSAPDLGHAWAVPVLMAYLWWERWSERPRIASSTPLGAAWWIVALALALAHLPLRLLLTPFPLWPVLLVVYTLLLAGTALTIAWLTGGRAGLRWLAGPLILLVSALPMPSRIESAVIIPLRELWAWLAAEISNLLGHPALAFGTSVRIGNGWVGVDEACGGIRSLQACVMIGLFFGEWFRFSLARRAALVAAGIAAALLGNFGRVLYLSLQATAGAGAVERSHDAAGWLSMGASLLITGCLACHWNGYRFPEPRSAVPAVTLAPGANPAISRRWKWAAFVAALLLLNEAATRTWFLLGARAVAALPQWTAVLPEEHWSFRSSSLPEVAREILQPDVFRAGSWRGDNATRVSVYYIEWNRGQLARSLPFLHNPTVCLPLAGCELVSTLGVVGVAWSGGEIPFHTYKFRQSGEEILVAFTIWDPSRGRPLVRQDFLSWADWWRAQWSEVREARQHQPAQLFTVTLPWSDTPTIAVQNALQPLLRPATTNAAAENL